MEVGASQSFQFFRQYTWLFESNGASSKCRRLFAPVLHYLISIIEL